MKHAYPTTPLQTGPNCVAYAFAFAIESALSALPPEYHRRINRAEIERLVGAPADVRVAATVLQFKYNWLQISTYAIAPVFAKAPYVTATWRNGISHAVCIFSHAHEYDPALGTTQVTHGTDKMANWTTVVAVKERCPVANRWRKYALYRALCSLVGYDSIP
jgi:hypothetical protein